MRSIKLIELPLYIKEIGSNAIDQQRRIRDSPYKDGNDYVYKKGSIEHGYLAHQSFLYVTEDLISKSLRSLILLITSIFQNISRLTIQSLTNRL